MPAMAAAKPAKKAAEKKAAEKKPAEKKPAAKPVRAGNAPLLSGLDAVDWKSWEHAFGTADDVPDLLRAVAGKDAKRAAKALDAIASSLNHQDLASLAAVPTLPFLVEIARAGKGRRARLLLLIADMASGGSHIEATVTGDPHETLAPELEPVRKALADGFDVFRHALDDPDAAIRTAAAVGLGTMPERADEAKAALLEQLGKEKTAPNLATMVLALGALAAATNDASLVETFAPLAKHKARAVQAAATIASAQARPEKLEALARLGVEPKLQSVKGIPWHEGRLGDLALGVALHHLGRQADVTTLERLMKVLSAYQIAEPLLHALFGSQPDRNTLPRTVAEIDPGHLPLLRALAAKLPATGSPLEYWGFLNTDRLLGLVPPRTLDSDFNGEPLWRLALKAREGLVPHSVWEHAVAELSPEQRIDLARDLEAPGNPYHLLDGWHENHWVEGWDIDTEHSAAHAKLVSTVLRAQPLDELERFVRKPEDKYGPSVNVIDVWTERCVDDGRPVDPKLDKVIAEVVDIPELAEATRRRTRPYRIRPGARVRRAARSALGRAVPRVRPRHGGCHGRRREARAEAQGQTHGRDPARSCRATLTAPPQGGGRSFTSQTKLPTPQRVRRTCGRVSPRSAFRRG